MRLEGRLRRVVLLAAPWVAVVLLWYAVRESGLVKTELVPTPAQVLEQFWRMLTTQRLWFNQVTNFNVDVGAFTNPVPALAATRRPTHVPGKACARHAG